MFQRIWVMADIHGSTSPIENFYDSYKEEIIFDRHTDCMILLGDTGVNFFLNNRDKKFKHELQNLPFTYFCIRGNHEQRPSILKKENPEDWNEEEFFGNTVFTEKIYPYIKYALDEPAFYDIDSYKTLVFPGAYSVDKKWRIIHHWTWFPEEQLTNEEMQKGIDLLTLYPQVDLILSHTCPIRFTPTELFLPSIDQSTVDNRMENYLGIIEYTIPYKLWLFGHFHKTKVYPKKYDRQVIMLYSDRTFNLNDYFNSNEPYESFY